MSHTQINNHGEPSSSLIHLWMAAIQSGHHDATATYLVGAADSFGGGAAVVSGSGAEKIIVVVVVVVVV